MVDWETIFLDWIYLSAMMTLNVGFDDTTYIIDGDK